VVEAGGIGVAGVVVVVPVVVDGVVVELVDPDPELELPEVCEPPSPGRRLSVTVVSGEAAVALPTAARPRNAASARIIASLLLIRLI
jgi:hypothetical protein